MKLRLGSKLQGSSFSVVDIFDISSSRYFFIFFFNSNWARTRPITSPTKPIILEQAKLLNLQNCCGHFTKSKYLGANKKLSSFSRTITLSLNGEVSLLFHPLFRHQIQFLRLLYWRKGRMACGSATACATWSMSSLKAALPSVPIQTLPSSLHFSIGKGSPSQSCVKVSTLTKPSPIPLQSFVGLAPFNPLLSFFSQGKCAHSLRILSVSNVCF